MTTHETAASAAETDPCARLAQLQHRANQQDVDPDHLLTEVRMHVNALELLPATQPGADLRRQCVCELVLLLDRYVTLGGRPPADWLDAFRRATNEPSG